MEKIIPIVKKSSEIVLQEERKLGENIILLNKINFSSSTDSGLKNLIRFFMLSRINYNICFNQ